MQQTSLMKAIDNIDSCLKENEFAEEIRVYLESMLKVLKATEKINYSMQKLTQELLNNNELEH